MLVSWELIVVIGEHLWYKDALKKMEIFQGVTGKLSFDDVGEAKREIHLLTLHRGKIKPLN